MVEFETESHVVVDSHVRIESVVLEDHRDISVLGFSVVDNLAVDIELTSGDIL